jgi:hypothetical protein
MSRATDKIVVLVKFSSLSERKSPKTVILREALPGSLANGDRSCVKLLGRA